MRYMIFVLLLLGGSALARELYPGQYAQVDTQTREWFERQKVPGEKDKTCCSQADGQMVQEDIKDGHYWVLCPLEGKCPFKTWTQVPDEAVIHGPNITGQPVVWWSSGMYGNGLPISPPTIRCYAPGAKG